jgi:hypothetical protein
MNLNHTLENKHCRLLTTVPLSLQKGPGSDLVCLWRHVLRRGTELLVKLSALFSQSPGRYRTQQPVPIYLRRPRRKAWPPGARGQKWLLNTCPASLCSLITQAVFRFWGLSVKHKIGAVSEYEEWP